MTNYNIFIARYLGRHQGWAHRALQEEKNKNKNKNKYA